MKYNFINRRPDYNKLRFIISFVIISIMTSALSKANVSFEADTTSGCAPLEVNFTNTSTQGNLFYWSLDDTVYQQTDVTHIFNSRGEFRVFLQGIDTSGGNFLPAGDYEMMIYVDGPPSQFTTSLKEDSACVSEQIVFEVDAPDAQSVEWNMGDGSPLKPGSYISHAYSDTGNYTVSVTIVNDCGTYVISEEIYVSNDLIPDVNFDLFPNQVCPGEQVSLTLLDYRYATYHWSYGNGETFTGFSHDYAYSTTGNYYVSLTVMNACGNYSSDSSLVEVRDDIQLSPFEHFYTSGTACPGAPFHFEFGNATMQYYSWDFGDGNTQRGEHFEISHRYSDTGTYVVTLDVTNFCGDSLRFNETVQISDDLGFDFVNLSYWPEESCPGDMVEFYLSSDGAASINWNFGDGSTANNKETVFHSYQDTGVYEVSVTVTNYCGNDTTLYTQVHIGDDIYPTDILYGHSAEDVGTCPGDPVYFFSFGGSAYEWNLGNGVLLTETYPVNIDGLTIDAVSYVFDSAGTFPVVLKYTNGCGNTVQRNMQVEIRDDLSADIVVDIIAGFDQGVANVCMPVTFAAFGGSHYDWDFGDGNFMSGDSFIVTHFYEAPGLYDVVVSGSNSCGDTSSYQFTVQVIDEIIPDFSISGDPSVPCEEFAFTASGGIEYEWNFGDGTEVLTTTNSTVTHVFAKDSTYEVTVSIHRACGEPIVQSRTLTIEEECDEVSIFEPGEKLSNLIMLFPNPASAYVNIKFTEPVKEEINVRIYDLQGRKLKETLIKTEQTDYTYRVDINNLQSGLYIVNITGSNVISKSLLRIQN